MLERALGCKCIPGGVLYRTYFTYAEARSWTQAHRWGVLLDAEA